MKVLTSKTDKKTKTRTLTVELAPDEEFVVIKVDSFYRMGEPMDDIVQGHIITNAVPAHWCVVSQKFVP